MTVLGSYGFQLKCRFCSIGTICTLAWATDNVGAWNRACWLSWWMVRVLLVDIGARLLVWGF